MQRVDGFGEIGDLKFVRFGMPRVDVVDEALTVFDEASSLPVTATKILPVRGMQVFAEIESVRSDMGEEFFERVDLLTHGVAAIVDQDIDPR